MTTTITLSPKEVEDLIRQQLRTQGFEVQGAITFNVTAGYSDPREYQPAGLTSVQATVTTAKAAAPKVKATSGPPDNLLNGAY